MGIWIGIDGGGTKTKFLAVSENGERLRSHISGGTYYHADGIEAVCGRLLEGISAGKSTEDVLGICFGMPGFGEGGAADAEAAARIRAALAPCAKRLWSAATALHDRTAEKKRLTSPQRSV